MEYLHYSSGILASWIIQQLLHDLKLTNMEKNSPIKRRRQESTMSLKTVLTNPTTTYTSTTPLRYLLVGHPVGEKRMDSYPVEGS